MPPLLIYTNSQQRITSLDLRILTAELNATILNYRLLNIYNVATSNRQYVLKFAIPDSKHLLVVDCGNKVHLTDFERPMAPAPLSFVAKLRKHLKSRRLTAIKQIDDDRILVFNFSDGEFYLVFEFFSAGNVLLLDKDLKILALQRLVKDLGPENATYATNVEYKAFDFLLFESEISRPEPQEVSFSEAQVKSWLHAHKQKLSESTEKSPKVFSIHKLLFVNASYLSNDLILKFLLEAGIEPSRSSLELEAHDELLHQVVRALNDTQNAYTDLVALSSQGRAVGYIEEIKNPLYKPEEKDSLEYVYDKFHPFKPYKKSDGFKLTPVEGYNKTIDQFFSTIESTKHTLRIEQTKQHAQKRLDNAKNERDRQIEQLVTQQEVNEKKGDAILYHAETVVACSNYVNEMIRKQMDWTDIENVIKFDAEKRRPEALVIKLPLKLLKNTIKLALVDPSQVDDSSLFNADSDSESDSSSESESESEVDSNSDYDSDDSLVKKPVKSRTKKAAKPSVPTLNVDIDLTQSAFANASLYFGQKKLASSKQAKVEKNSNMAMKNAEKRVERDLAKKLKNEVDALKTIRHKYWFEKYFWFVTNEGYLCLAGRDDNQVDMIYYRHFSDHGYLVSSDIEGALKVFILNPFPNEDVPPMTIFHAGIFALLTSDAWNSKASSSAWWLKGKDVTKMEYDGSLLGPGRLKHKAERNYMPPAQLVMGFGLYWLGDEATAKKYTDARIRKQEEHGLKVKVNRRKADLEGLDVKKMSLESNADFKPSMEEKGTQNQEEDDKNLGPEGNEAKEKDGSDLGENSTEVTPETETPNPSVHGSNPVKAVRGKKGKLKKQKAKYADQDEEERRLRIEALGTLKQIEALKQKKMEEMQKQQEAAKNKYNQQKSAEERDRKAEERELQKYFDEDEDVFDESYLTMLDSLISKPAKDDVIATAVPVFAPWGALSKFKYKVKVQPGSGKKGKSVAEAYSFFGKRKVDAAKEDADEAWPEELPIIKTLAPNDAIASITASKIKMSLPGSISNAKKGNNKGKR